MEQLTDVTLETNNPERKTFEAVFKQCRPLVREPHLATVVILPYLILAGAFFERNPVKIYH